MIQLFTFVYNSKEEFEKWKTIRICCHLEKRIQKWIYHSHQQIKICAILSTN